MVSYMCRYFHIHETRKVFNMVFNTKSNQYFEKYLQYIPVGFKIIALNFDSTVYRQQCSKQTTNGQTRRSQVVVYPFFSHFIVKLVFIKWLHLICFQLRIITKLLPLINYELLQMLIKHHTCLSVFLNDIHKIHQNYLFVILVDYCKTK